MWLVGSVCGWISLWMGIYRNKRMCISPMKTNVSPLEVLNIKQSCAYQVYGVNYTTAENETPVLYEHSLEWPLTSGKQNSVYDGGAIFLFRMRFDSGWKTKHFPI